MMKKFLYGVMAATMMFASSCENELELGAAGEESVVSFTIATPDMGSRAYSDGATATVLQYAVYDAAGNLLPKLTVTNAKIDGSAEVKLKLTTGNTYSVVFWAAAPSTTEKPSPYTVNFANELENASMTVDYTNAVSNDESRDAFYKYETFTVNGAEAKTIELKRPFAQLNIGTADYAASTSAGYTPKYSYVKVPVSSVLYFKNGDVNEATTQDFGLAEIPTEKLVVNGTEYTYLAMNYLLVDDEKDVVDVEFGYGESNNVSTAKTRTVGSVPVQRNYRTNIYGNILTSEVDINVNIVPDYEKDDNNVGVPYVTIGDVIYNTFAEALTAAKDGETIVLQGELVLKATANENLFKVEKKISIDLNGNALVGQIPDVTKNTAVFEVIEGGSLTIQGEGDVRVVTAKAPDVLAAMINNNGGVVNLKGGNWTMVALDYPDALIPTFVDNNSNVNDATLNIYGGTYTFHRNLFRNFANAASHNGYATVATINIYGGTFNGRADDAGAIWNQKPSASVPDGAGVINLNGGTFNNVVISDDFGVIKYASTANELQDALDDAPAGATIFITEDITGDLTVEQDSEGTITINGEGNTFNGVITVDGKSAANMNAGLTIKDLTFSATTTGRSSNTSDACIRLGDGTPETRYTSNVTVDNCTFDANGMVGIKSYTGGDKNLTITNCTATTNAHSLLQIKGVDGVNIQNCTVNSKNGMNFNNSNNVTIDGCTVEVKGYAVRFGESSGDLGVAEAYSIKNSTLKSACEEGDAVIILRGTADKSTLTITNSTLEGNPLINNTATDALVLVDGEQVSPALPVAKVGNTEYTSINEAIANWGNNTTLTLLKNVTLNDVITLKSTEHHILNLGTYTMTAAEGKNAFVIQACGTGNAERTAITIKADAENPGGINAGSKCIVYYKYADGGISGNDRPIITIEGGVFTGSTSGWGTAGIYTIGTEARKCATLNISGGTFNCTINGTTKSKLLISGGTFNYSVGSQGDSTALRLIWGGRFKTLGFMTADSNNTKFWFGTSMANSNVGLYVDDEGYLVVGGPVITEFGDKFAAKATNATKWSSYLQYSSAAANGLYYTNAEMAIKKHGEANVVLK